MLYVQLLIVTIPMYVYTPFLYIALISVAWFTSAPSATRSTSGKRSIPFAQRAGIHLQVISH